MIRHAVAIIAVMLPLVVPANAGGAAIVTILNIARGSPHHQRSNPGELYRCWQQSDDTLTCKREASEEIRGGGVKPIMTCKTLKRPHTSAVWCSDGTTFYFDTQTGKLKG